MNDEQEKIVKYLRARANRYLEHAKYCNTSVPQDMPPFMKAQKGTRKSKLGREARKCQQWGEILLQVAQEVEDGKHLKE